MKLKIAVVVLAVWAVIVTAMLLWVSVSDAPWEGPNYRCRDALVGMRTGGGSYYYEQITQWCR